MPQWHYHNSSIFWVHRSHLPRCSTELEYCITAMSPSRTVKCITCMNQVVISNLWGSLAFIAHVWPVWRSWLKLMALRTPFSNTVVLILYWGQWHCKTNQMSLCSFFLRKHWLCNYEMQLCFHTKHFFSAYSSTSTGTFAHNSQLVLTCEKHQVGGSCSSTQIKYCLMSSQVLNGSF